MQVVYENCDCRRISGPSLLEVTYRQHLHGMRPTTRDTQTPLYHAAVDLAFVIDDDVKMLKMQHSLLIMDSPDGGGGLPPRVLHVLVNRLLYVNQRGQLSLSSFCLVFVFEQFSGSIIV